MKSTSRITAAFLGIILLSLATGCTKNDAPEVGYVTGVVTLDGQPLDAATVEFVPVDNPTQRPSTSQTDQSGHYELYYSASRKGAALGQHQVTIKKIQSDNPEAKEQPLVTPAKYAKPGELKAKVEKGSQTIDFELKP